VIAEADRSARRTSTSNHTRIVKTWLCACASTVLLHLHGIPGLSRAVVSRIKLWPTLTSPNDANPRRQDRYRWQGSRGRNTRRDPATSGQDEDVVLRLLTASNRCRSTRWNSPRHFAGHSSHRRESARNHSLCRTDWSGKTTTLHAILKYVNTDERKIWTAEDPLK